MKFSVIIPVKEINDYVGTNVATILRSGYESLEIIVLPNDPEINQWPDDPQVRVIPTGRVAPGVKRDKGAEIALGDYLVFLDDDSFPNQNYFKVAETAIATNEVPVAIGGPGVTPTTNTFIQKSSGAFFCSSIGGGFPERYLSRKPSRFFDDWPSVNLIVKTSAFREVGGYGTDIWPGEDTFLCNKLKNILQARVLYIPELIVMHHRRGGWVKHMKQVGQYGLMRGHLTRIAGGNSLKAKTMLPTILSLYTLFSLVYLLLATNVSPLLLLPWLAYLTVVFGVLLETAIRFNISLGFGTLLFTGPSHFWYGIRYIEGAIRTTVRPQLN